MLKKPLAVCLALMLCLSGCSEARQVENQAFVVLLGLDRAAEDGIELTVQVPRIKGSEDGSEENGDFMVLTAVGRTFTEALEVCSIASPRRINLTQVKMIVVSEALAREERFPALLKEMAATYTLYSTSYFTVCEGGARAFIEREVPTFSADASTSLTALLEHHSSRGYIPRTTFAEVYYRTNSFYSDPVAVLAGGTADNAAHGPADDAPAPIHPENVPATLENGNAFAGGALFRQGRFVGTLDAAEMTFVNLLLGRREEIILRTDAGSVRLFPSCKPKIHIDCKSNPMTISYAQRFTMESTTGTDDPEEVCAKIGEQIANLVLKCQRLGVEPFGMADRAAAQFLTTARWEEFNWLERFTSARVSIRPTVVPYRK